MVRVKQERSIDSTYRFSEKLFDNSYERGKEKISLSLS